LGQSVFVQFEDTKKRNTNTSRSRSSSSNNNNNNGNNSNNSTREANGRGGFTAASLVREYLERVQNKENSNGGNDDHDHDHDGYNRVHIEDEVDRSTGRSTHSCDRNDGSRNQMTNEQDCSSSVSASANAKEKGEFHSNIHILENKLRDLMSKESSK